MQQERKKLTLRSAAADVDLPGLDVAGARTMREAILRRLCVAATYNRTPVTLAPHILYTRHGEPFVDGVVLEREGKPPKELKLGTFKLAGLVGLSLTPLNFEVQPLFEADNPKYADVTLSVVAR